MRQRLPFYLGAGLAVFAAYMQFLAMGWEPAATAALLAILIGIFAVTGFEAWLHERNCEPEFPEHRGWFDAEEVRAVLGPQADDTVQIPLWTDPDDLPAVDGDEGVGPDVGVPAPPADATPLSIEAEALAAVAQERAVLDEIADRYTAHVEATQRDMAEVAAELRARFDQAEWELGVYR